MAKGLDAGKAFFSGVLAKISDPAQKAAAEALLANELVMTEIGGGVLGQAEIDRRLQELTTKTSDLETRTAELAEQRANLDTVHDKQVEWYTTNKTALEEYNRLKAGGAGGTGGTADPTKKPFTTDDFTAAITNERASFLGFQRDQNALTREHFGKFGEILDLEPLLRHPQIGQVGLTGVYQILHKERLEKFETDKKQKDEEAIRADERQKVLQSQAAMPYPTPTGVGSGSPLDALTGAKPNDTVVDAATAHYNRLQMERAGAR